MREGGSVSVWLLLSALVTYPSVPSAKPTRVPMKPFFFFFTCCFSGALSFSSSCQYQARAPKASRDMDNMHVERVKACDDLSRLMMGPSLPFDSCGGIDARVFRLPVSP